MAEEEQEDNQQENEQEEQQEGEGEENQNQEGEGEEGQEEEKKEGEENGEEQEPPPPPEKTFRELNPHQFSLENFTSTSSELQMMKKIKSEVKGKSSNFPFCCYNIEGKAYVAYLSERMGKNHAYLIEIYDIAEDKIIKEIVTKNTQLIGKMKYFKDFYTETHYILTYSYDGQIILYNINEDFKEELSIQTTFKADDIYYGLTMVFLAPEVPENQENAENPEENKEEEENPEENKKEENKNEAKEEEKKEEKKVVIKPPFNILIGNKSKSSSSDENEKIQIYNQKGEKLESLNYETMRRIRDLQTYYTKEEILITITASEEGIIVYNFTGKEVKTTLKQNNENTPFICSLVYEKKGELFLVAADSNRTMSLWNIATEQLVYQFCYNYYKLMPAISLWNEKHLLVAGNFYNVNIFDLETKTKVEGLEEVHKLPITCIDKIKGNDKEYLLSMDEGFNLVIWRTPDYS